VNRFDGFELGHEVERVLLSRFLTALCVLLIRDKDCSGRRVWHRRARTSDLSGIRQMDDPNDGQGTPLSNRLHQVLERLDKFRRMEKAQ